MVTWGNRQFYINGEPLEIHAGSKHYFRSLPEKWPELLLKLKQCGLNAVETYCAWNLHEPQPGQYDFSGRLDVEKFISLAEELGLYVIVRPGPFICAEWEFGGLPGWLLKDNNFRCRTEDGEYLTYVRRYFDELMPRLLPHMETRGGKIILFAAENEYGSFGESTSYMNACAQILRDYGVDVPIITADGNTEMFYSGGHADDCLIAMDFGYDQGNLGDGHLADLWARQPDAPPFHVEFWIGMFAHWGEPYQGYKTEHIAKEMRWHLENHISFNLYMFHGGTNFGFTNGANYFGRDPDNRLHRTYLPDVTSYDYDAPLTEWGEITPKYLEIQKQMSEYLGVELPRPDPVPRQNIGDIPLTQAAPLFGNLSQIGEKHVSVCQHSMEYYGQNYGYILYRTQIKANERLNLLAVEGVADRANVYFNGVWRGLISRNDKETCLDVDGWMDEGGTLDILVENQGRINFGYEVDHGDRKGILKHVTVYQKYGPGQIQYDWEVYTLPMEDLDCLQWGGEIPPDQPVFYKGNFRATEQTDCFVHLAHFKKGFVVVNGFNLGRYWEIGPQRSLYLPGSLLKEENEIIVFAEQPTETPVISIRDYHVLAETKTEEGPVTIM